MKDKKTTAAALVTLIGALCTLVIAPLVDGNDATAPQWAVFAPIASACLMGFLASDSKPQPPAPPAPSA